MCPRVQTPRREIQNDKSYTPLNLVLSIIIGHIYSALTPIKDRTHKIKMSPKIHFLKSKMSKLNGTNCKKKTMPILDHISCP
jgi:hypothetical protein